MAKNSEPAENVPVAEEPKKKPITAEEVAEVRLNTKRLLDLQPKKEIRLRRPEGQDAKINYETVCINGYIYQIEYGKSVQVPQTVYEVLVNAGLY